MWESLVMSDIELEMIKKEKGILPMFEPFYLESIVHTADRANAAFERFDNALISGDLNKGLIVANIQEALTHIGELSRYFWPARDNGISIPRGEKLREAFGLRDDSLLKDRKLRDALEHFDERLDIYLKQFPVGQLITTPIVGSIESLVPPMRVFRMVDPARSTFVILDEKYEFGALREINKNVLIRGQKILKDGKS